LAHAKKVLPELLAKAADSKHRRVSTYFFEGKEGMQQALAYGRDELAEKELLCYYAQSEKGARSIPSYYYQNNKALSAQKTKIRSVRSTHDSFAEFRTIEKESGWSSLVLAEPEFSSRVTVEIAPHFVRILLHKDLQALVVENTAFADMMRQVFEVVWKARSDLK
jgi:hypothetical protein